MVSFARQLVALTLAVISFTGIRSFQVSLYRGRSSNGRGYQGRIDPPFAWFGGGGGDPTTNEGKSGQSQTSGALGSIEQSLAGVSGTMMAMENFKASQSIGKATEALVQDLSSITIEGSSSNGKVKVSLDGCQQPIGASMDEAFFKEATSSSVTSAFVEAMKDAHAKSKDTMNDKMKGLYNDLGVSYEK